MYLNEHHNPGGNAINHVRADVLHAETNWARSGIFSMALEAREAQLFTLTMKKGYRIPDNDPECLDLIGLRNDVYRKTGI